MVVTIINTSSLSTLVIYIQIIPFLAYQTFILIRMVKPAISNRRIRILTYTIQKILHIFSTILNIFPSFSTVFTNTISNKFLAILYSFPTLISLFSNISSLFNYCIILTAFTNIVIIISMIFTILNRLSCCTGIVLFLVKISFTF